MVSNVTWQKLDTRFVKKLSTSDALFVLDGSQAAPHMLLDLPRIGGDVVYFTGHKVGALTGIGVLQWRSSLLSSLLPGRSWGGAIQEVTLTGHTYQSLPDKFEAGTPNVVGAVSLHAALERISSLSPSSGSFREQLGRGFEWMQLREKELIDFFSDQMRDLVAAQQVQMVGSLESAARIGLFSFLISPEIGDVQGLGRAFAQQNICIRVWAHCTHPLHTYLPGEQSARVSVRAYNDVEDIRLFFLVLRKYIWIN